MIEIRGNRKEIAEAVKAIAPTYPTALIEHLDPGEWHFILNGIDVKLTIKEEHNDRKR